MPNQDTAAKMYGMRDTPQQASKHSGPHKHYASEVIENVVDEVVTPDDEITEDYPCVATIDRWKKWLLDSIGAINAM